MRQEQGLKALLEGCQGHISASVLAVLLMQDLKNCQCFIYGELQDGEPVLLATLKINPESLFYEQFDQRLEFVVEGSILDDHNVPLRYEVVGNKFSFSGRCSTIGKVCGVDLYLSASYGGKKGDWVQQKFKVSVKQLLKKLNV